MIEHVIYFELYGKKMKCTITAESKEDAVNILKDKIKVVKIEVAHNNGLEYLKNMFGIK